MFKRLILASVFVVAVWAVAMPNEMSNDRLGETLSRVVVDRLEAAQLQTFSWFNMPSNPPSNK